MVHAAKLFQDPFDEILLQAIKDPNKRYQFYKEFLKLELVVIGTVDNLGESVIEEDTQLNLKYIEMENELVLPIYSSLEKFKAIFGEQFTYIKIPADLLLNMVEIEHPWVLNPGYDLSKKMISEELETLRDGRIIHHFFEQLSEEEKERLLTEEIAEISDEDMKFIINCLETVSQVKRAYRVNIFHPALNSSPSPLLALELDEMDRERSIKMIAVIHQTINQLVKIDAEIEMMVLDENIPISNSIKERTKPFYIRNSIEDLESMFY